jgi:MtN3 and saliva related transmembrane protein
MDLIELLSLIAGLMTTGAPIMQVIKTVRSRDYAGLSVGSYLLLLCLGSFTVLIGIQYKIVAMIVLNSISLFANMVMMLILSRMTLAAFLLTLGVAALVSSLVAPWFLPLLFTPHWGEQVAFVYGLVSAAAFLPQLILTHRTRIVSSFSAFYLMLLAGGMILWVIVATMLGNYSLTFWNFVLFVMVAELLRLKVVGERRSRAAQEVEPVVPPLV